MHWTACPHDSFGRRLIVCGAGGALTYPSSDDPLFMGNAGTAARFLTSILCTLPDKCVVPASVSPFPFLAVPGRVPHSCCACVALTRLPVSSLPHTSPTHRVVVLSSGLGRWF
jgi:hypothetical protein